MPFVQAVPQPHAGASRDLPKGYTAENVSNAHGAVVVEIPEDLVPVLDHREVIGRAFEDLLQTVVLGGVPAAGVGRRRMKERGVIAEYGHGSPSYRSKVPSAPRAVRNNVAGGLHRRLDCDAPKCRSAPPP